MHLVLASAANIAETINEKIFQSNKKYYNNTIVNCFFILHLIYSAAISSNK
jgi:hypothetical protein